MSEHQVRDIKSIVYAGQNEISNECVANLRKYLAKRAPYALVDLKLIGLKCTEPEVISNVIAELRTDFKLQNLSLSKV